MYERNESLAQQKIAAAAGMAGGTLGGIGYACQASAPQDISATPIEQAMAELEREIAILREQFGMLLGRLGPICKPLPKEVGNSKGEPSNCQLEGRINASKYGIAEIRGLVYCARDALCI